jgi:hypothetical protein
MYTSDQMDQIHAFRAEVESSLESIRLEYAKGEGLGPRA